MENREFCLADEAYSIRVKYGERIKNLKDEINNLKLQIDDLKKQRNGGLPYERRLNLVKKIIKPLVIGAMFAVVFPNLVYAIITKYTAFTLLSLGLMSVASVGCTIIEKKLEKLAMDESEKVAVDISELELGLSKNVDDLKHVEKILLSFNQKIDFLKSPALQFLIKKKFAAEYEKIFLEYMEKDISILSLLYLADNGRLPKKCPSEMTGDELNNIMQLLHDKDKELTDNPGLLFENASKESQRVPREMLVKPSSPIYTDDYSYHADESEWTTRFEPVRVGCVPTEPEELPVFEPVRDGGRRR